MLVKRARRSRRWMPRVAGDILDILYQAGVAEIVGPASHHGIEGRQPTVLIHPGPGSGSERFDLLFHPFLRLGGGTEMDYPTSFGFDPLEMKPQKVKALIDMRNPGLLLRQHKVEFVVEKVFDFLLSGFHFSNAGIAHDRKV